MEERHGHLDKKIYIKAKKIEIGKKVIFGNNTDIRINGDLNIGDRTHFGDNIHIRGNNITFGEDVFCSGGLRIGGGGRNNPTADFNIGDRCTIHNNFINICKRVSIGNDVGLSPDVAILTHGYWLSVLEGYPAKFEEVLIGNKVIVGYRSLIMMGVQIGYGAVVGANSVVTKNLRPKSIYAGNPARFIREVIPLTGIKRIERLKYIIKEYEPIAQFHGIEPDIELVYPQIYFAGCEFNVETFMVYGEENEETDDFRDYLRKWGLRFYTDRPFKIKKVQ